MNNMKHKILLTLALLITAVGGAWAQDPVDGTIAWSVGNEASATVSASIMDAISSTGVTTGSGLTVSNADYFDTDMMKYQPATANAGNVEGVMIEYTIEAVDGYKFKPTGVDYAAVKDGTDNASYSWSYTIDGVESAITDVSMNDVLRSSGSNSATAQLMHSESITADGCSVFTLRFYISNCSNTKKICIGNITISGSVSAAEAPIEVTTNAANKQDLFTEAWFTMPVSDVTVNYTLVRDMQDETNPVAFSGLPSSGNIVVKKGSDGKYQPAEALTIQLIDPLAAAEAQNIIAADGITIKVLVGAENGQGAIDYDQENPITLEAFLADMKPGYYWIKAESTDENSPYDGTVYSSEFTVVEKYDLTVKPANDFSKGKIDKVVVGTEEITPDANTGEATKTGIAPDTEVKIKAKKGYIIEKVEAKKTSTPN